VRPNPFHRALAVEFELSRPGRVKLELYDLTGRRVRASVENQMAAGRSLRVLDGAGLPSGVYVLRFEAQGLTRTQRVVLLR
jgi:hypothetical protein